MYSCGAAACLAGSAVACFPGAAGCCAWLARAEAGDTHSCCCCCCRRGADGGRRSRRRNCDRAETPGRRERGGRCALSGAPRCERCCCGRRCGCGCRCGPAGQNCPVSCDGTAACAGPVYAYRAPPTGLLGRHLPHPLPHHSSLRLPHHTIISPLWPADSTSAATAVPVSSLPRRCRCCHYGSCHTSHHHAAPIPPPTTSAVTATVASTFASTSALPRCAATMPVGDGFRRHDHPIPAAPAATQPRPAAPLPNPPYPTVPQSCPRAAPCFVPADLQVLP